MRVLVTGGAGFFGINMVRRLLADNHQVISFDLAPFNYPERARIQEVTGDIRDYDSIHASMSSVDVCIHAAAALPLYSEEDIRTTDITGTENVLKACKESGVKRLIHISSTAVYGIPEKHPVYEDDQLIGVGPYGEAKVIAESLCIEYRAKGLTVTILRPKSFVGPERLGVFALLYDWAHDGRGFPVLGSGNNLYQLLDVEDLCDAVILAIEAEPEIANDTYNIGASQFRTIKEDYQAVLDQAGFGKKIRPVPAAPAIALLRFLEKLGLSPLYKWVYETAGKDSYVSIDKAVNRLGYKPQYSNQQALLRNYEWYLANLEKFSDSAGVTHRVPWKQGLLSIAKKFF